MRPSKLQELAHNFFVDSAAHHTALAKAHQLATEDENSTEGSYAFHKAASEAHAAMGERCLALCKALDPALKLFKAFMDDDEVLPSPVSRVAPEKPAGVVAVPRPGQPQLTQKAELPPEFLKLTMIDEDEVIQ